MSTAESKSFAWVRRAWGPCPLYAGVDPGKYGAIVLLNSAGELVGIHDYPHELDDAALLRIDDWLRMDGLVGEIAYSAVERAMAGKEGGRVGLLTFGLNAGAWRGLLVGHGIRCEWVHPKTWQALALRGRPKGRPKTRAHAYASERWGIGLFVNDTGKAMYGRSDAACIALYALWQHKLQKES